MSAPFTIPTEFSGTPEFPHDYYGPANPHPKTRQLRADIMVILEQWHPYGDRGVTYQLLAHYGYPKVDATFDAVERQIRIMRLNGRIPFDWIVDESRQIEKLAWWSSPAVLLKAAADQYRADLWKDQPRAVMVACEKHGLGGVLRKATEPWRVPLATLGGTYSHSFAGDIIEWIAGYDDRPVSIFYLGDFDPTGVQIPQWLHRNIYAIAPVKVPESDRTHYANNVKIVRLAVNDLEQARAHGGISRATKVEKNTHADSIAWPADVDSVEVDSIPPDVLQDMVPRRFRTKSTRSPGVGISPTSNSKGIRLPATPKTSERGGGSDSSETRKSNWRGHD